MKLQEEIKGMNIASPEVYSRFMARFSEGRLSRDENPASHFGIYFLPYNPITKKVFMVHHRKSGLWIAPGGHVDEGEEAFETLVREMKEELGVVYAPPVGTQPFLLTITPIDNPSYTCKIHFDVWYGEETDGSNFHIDPREFLETRWLTIMEARELVTDGSNLQALAKMEQVFN